MVNEKPRIGVLLGDAAGVGPEIVAKLLARGFFQEICRPLIIGDRRVLERAVLLLGEEGKHALDLLGGGEETSLLDLCDLDPADVPFGVGTEAAGRANVDAIHAAIRLCQEKKIEGFVFGPFNKAMLKADKRMERSDGSHYESEHHYIAHLLGHTAPFGEINAVGKVWTTRTTSHIPVKEVAAALTQTSIGRAIELMRVTLVHAGIPDPAIAVAALNPHAGEDGTCGREEVDVIAPAIEAANQKYGTKRITGPYPSDTLFVKAFRGDFDGVVTMYHDQGQIALKVVGFDEGITIAGGFPIPIVTGGHGTAYDIAGRNVVKTHAFENAVKMCVRMAHARRKADGGTDEWK